MALSLFSLSCGQNAHVTGLDSFGVLIPGDENNPGGSTDIPPIPPSTHTPPGTPTGSPPTNPPGMPPQKDPHPPQCKPIHRYLRFESCSLTQDESAWFMTGQAGFAFDLELPPRSQVKALISATLRFEGHEVPAVAALDEELCRLGPENGCMGIAGKNPHELELTQLGGSASNWIDFLYVNPRLVLGAPACWGEWRAQLTVVFELENPSCP